MDQRVIQLEILRQQIQAAESALGQRINYMDRGHPNAQEEAETMEEYLIFEQESTQIREKLGAQLDKLRISAPQVIAAWVEWHSAICQRILTEDPGTYTPDGMVTDQQVRLSVAGETLKSWQEVLTGQLDYVSINDYFMEDYARQLAAAVEENADSATVP